MPNRVWILFFLLTGQLIVLLNCSVTAQPEKMIRRFAASLDEVNASFKMPPNYFEIDSGRRFPCGDYQITNAMLYTICNTDSSIRIGFSIVRPVSQKIVARVKVQNPSFTAADAHLNSARVKADTVNHKLVFYDHGYLAKFNADIGGEYTRNCTLPYEDKYPYNKVVFIYKEGQGHMELTYFYTEEAKDTIDSVIVNTAGIVQYGD